MAADDRPDYAALALQLHRHYRGKVSTAVHVPVETSDDLGTWYTPGVAAPCRAIAQDPEQVWSMTARQNRVAVVSDGTRVLGLGPIGPEAGLPVMEGKALLFKVFGGVDAQPLCIAPVDDDAFIELLRAIAPTYGAINLEDISQPRCFRLLERARAALDIPVWHDDQQGSAVVAVAGLLGALEVVGKPLDDVRVVVLGAGSAGMATWRLLSAAGVDVERCLMCDSSGILGAHRADLERTQDAWAEKWAVCRASNPAGKAGGIDEALAGADAVISFTRPGPDVIPPAAVASMARDAIVFACANPTPEIWPADAMAAGARIVGTGRGDFPNQVNNSLAFPGVFRGALDVRARTISDSMALAAARALVEVAREAGLSETSVVPSMHDPEVAPRIAAAVGAKAVEEGLARAPRSRGELLSAARTRIAHTRRALEAWRDAGVVTRPD